jgi:hypothetical protein
MIEPKLPHAIVGSILTWAAAVWAFMETHMTMIAGTCAVVASLYTISAARQTAKLRKMQQRQFEEENDL